MERRTFFVDVLLPLHLPDTYTYRVPFDYNDYIRVGQRVVVQFGSKRLYSAIVRRVHETVPSYTTKYVLSILDLEPVVTERQLLFWEWMAAYYMCYPGDVMAVAIPSAFRLSSESYIVVHPDFAGEYGNLGEDEIKILDVLSRKGRLEIGEIADITGYQKIMPLIKSMIERHIILMDEELRQRFTPRKSVWLALNDKYRDEQNLKQLFDEMEKKSSNQKQLLALMQFLQLSGFGQREIKKKVLADNKELSASAIDTLVKKEVLVQIQREESRLQHYESTTDVASIALNEEQQRAFDTIVACDKAVSLLHGVTSSGKTEVYIRLIDRTLREGKQVLLLLPEIALTAQIINRLRKYFGDSVGVYHSRFSTKERAEVWQRTMDASESGYKVLLGARSALFLPFHNLGLVIVDEEHDSSYKQNDPAPRYNGRDSAIYLARMWNAKTLLGSATPSVESFYGGWSYSVRFDIPATNAEGKSLITSKLSYQVMVEKDGAQQVLPLTVACYPMLEQDMEEVPYNFEAKWDILLHGKMINLNQGEEEIKTWSKIGVRSIYRGGGEEHTSDIGWYDLEPFWQEMGIEQTTTAAEPADDAWYTVTGVRVTKPAAAGLYIHKGRKVVVR